MSGRKKNTYCVEALYNHGVFRGKRLVPENDYYKTFYAELELYSENQIKVVLSKMLANYGVINPVIVDFTYHIKDK